MISPFRPRHFRLAVAGLSAGVIAVVAIACSSPVPEPVAPVATVKAKVSDSISERAPKHARAEYTVVVDSEVASRTCTENVDCGHRVAKGDTLMVINRVTHDTVRALYRGKNDREAPSVTEVGDTLHRAYMSNDDVEVPSVACDKSGACLTTVAGKPTPLLRPFMEVRVPSVTESSALTKCNAAQTTAKTCRP